MRSEKRNSKILQESSISRELVDDCERSLKLLEHLSAAEKLKDMKLKNMAWRIRQSQLYI